mmetsp:Transcript_13025/g.20735  ORF Transcript_13025/g.20735 Transcript_13025/m.20735 type:complete len:269 (-) Transcript_13025:796-1602(-)
MKTRKRRKSGPTRCQLQKNAIKVSRRESSQRTGLNLLQRCPRAEIEWTGTGRSDCGSPHQARPFTTSLAGRWTSPGRWRRRAWTRAASPRPPWAPPPRPSSPSPRAAATATTTTPGCWRRWSCTQMPRTRSPGFSAPPTPSRKATRPRSSRSSTPGGAAATASWCSATWKTPLCRVSPSILRAPRSIRTSGRRCAPSGSTCGRTTARTSTGSTWAVTTSTCSWTTCASIFCQTRFKKQARKEKCLCFWGEGSSLQMTTFSTRVGLDTF